MSDSDKPVRVTLNVSDWLKVPTRTYSKVVEFDREEWDEMSPRDREDSIEEQLRDFCLETFSRDYEIDGGDLDDPTA